jgi:hypothetical protein
MPIWLRKFTFNKIKEWYDKERQDVDGQTTVTASTDMKKLKIPLPPKISQSNTKPTYTSKVSKK